MKVGFIGLGNMGRAMARNIARAGHELTVYNRTRSRAEELRQDGAHVADSPYDTALNADVVITMLANDEAVEEIVFGGGGTQGEGMRGVIHGLRQGALHVSMSTISVSLSKRLADAHLRAGQSYIAAPVFGRPEAAVAAKLWVMVSGPQEEIRRCRPLLDSMGQGVFTVGEEPWLANVVKLAGNFIVASMLEALGEALTLVRKSGVDANRFLEIINALFQSPVYKNYGSIMVEERYEPAGFKTKLGFKDMRLVIEAAEDTATPMPLASLIRDHLLSAIARGRGDIDWAGLARVIAENAGLR
jgi:3-hydroxyisobutyrate dehydrogenase-like beta-hydroxyacid dehydrogenase